MHERMNAFLDMETPEMRAILERTEWSYTTPDVCDLILSYCRFDVDKELFVRNQTVRQAVTAEQVTSCGLGTLLTLCFLVFPFSRSPI